MQLEPGQLLEDKISHRPLARGRRHGRGVRRGKHVHSSSCGDQVLHGAAPEHGDALSRFEREAQAAGRIGSDHITEVLDLGRTADGERFMVMEFLQGETLGTRMRELSRLTPVEAAPILDQLLEGLSAAHHAGIIHRDLKPENIFLVRNKAGVRDFVKILDFGVSKFTNFRDGALGMTTTGMVVGTPYYMSPEQARGAKSVDTRSDLFAVGVILYEMVAGQVPFHADTFNELLFKIALEDPPPLGTLVEGIDVAFVRLIQRAMAREPADRFATAEAFREALVSWATETGTPLQLPSSLRAGLSSYPPPSSQSRAARLSLVPSLERRLSGAELPVLGAPLSDRAFFPTLTGAPSEMSGSHPWVHTHHPPNAASPSSWRRHARRLVLTVAALTVVTGALGLVFRLVGASQQRAAAASHSAAAASSPAGERGVSPPPAESVAPPPSPPALSVSAPSVAAPVPRSAAGGATGKERKAPAEIDKGKRIIRDQL